MANPPKKPTGTTPPRRKAAARKATPPKAPKVEAVDNTPTATPTETATPAAPAAPKKPRTPRRAAAPAAEKASAKPRTTKRAEAVRAPAHKRVADSAPVQYVAETREKMGDRNFFAAVLGATAAVGAAVAGVVLALRTGRSDSDAVAGTPNAGAGAHQADGTDSSAQFAAGIADEGMVPDKLPEA